jgi:hypothetical protein
MVGVLVEQWSVIFQTVDDLVSMVGAIAALIVLIKQDRDRTDRRDD